MNIGVDLDGVVYNSEFWLQAFAEIYDIKNNGNGIVDKSENSISKRYGWDDDYALKFRLKYLPEQIKKSPLMPLVKETLQLLIEMGHKIIIITSRGGVSEDHIKLTKDRLKEDNVPYTELYFSKDSKVELCKKNKIDIMIDDTPKVVEELVEQDIKCLYFKNGTTKEIINSKVQTVLNWGEVFRQVYIFSKNKNYDSTKVSKLI